MNKEKFVSVMTQQINDTFGDLKFSETFVARGEQLIESLPPVANDTWNEEFAEHVCTKFEEQTERLLTGAVIKDGVVYPENTNPTTDEMDEELLTIASSVEGVPEEYLCVIIEVTQTVQNVITDRAV